MSDFVLAVPWQDRYARGVQGVIEIYQSDLRQESRRLSDQDDDVKDLTEILTKKFAKTEGGTRLVKAIWLYGTKLNGFRLLKSIIPVAVEGCPCLVAKTKFVLENACGFTVKLLTGETGFIPAFFTDSIDNFKCKIEDRWGIPPEKQRLTYEGKQLEDFRTLGDYKLENRSVLHLFLKLRGGGGGSPRRFVDVSDHSNLHEHNLSSSAPDWRICKQGLNIEGECENRECEAFGEMVIRQNAFNSFNLMGDNEIRCPRCYEVFKPITCGFYKCVWMFEGVRSSDGCFISSPWRDAGGSKYHRFDADEDYGSIEWDSLLIVVKSRRESPAAKVPVSTRSVLVRKDNVCSICWSRFGSTAKKIVVAAQCGHSFHRVCLDTWSKWCRGHDTLPRCPLCRNAAVVDETER